ncbi:MAG: DMT family transporter [archaeon]|nr:MAG: DMT family transporter [archaeon]
MLWAILSIFGAFIFAVVNVIDKYILIKWVREPIIPVMILSTVGLTASALIYLIRGFSYLSYFNIFLGLFCGFFYILSNILFFRALKIEEVSRVIPLFYLTPLFTLILASVFLGEVFTWLKYLGIFMIVSGSILISTRRTTKIKLNKAFWLMILAGIFLSFNAIISKYLLGISDYWTVFGYTRIGAFILSIPLLYFYLPNLISMVKEYGKKTIGVITANETANVFAMLLITIATAIGFVSLVSTLMSTEPFFVLLFVVIISRFYPKILKEEVSRKIIIMKLTAIVCMFIGIILII